MATMKGSEQFCLIWRMDHNWNGYMMHTVVSPLISLGNPAHKIPILPIPVKRNLTWIQVIDGKQFGLTKYPLSKGSTLIPTYIFVFSLTIFRDCWNWPSSYIWPTLTGWLLWKYQRDLTSFARHNQLKQVHNDPSGWVTGSSSKAYIPMPNIFLPMI